MWNMPIWSSTPRRAILPDASKPRLSTGPNGTLKVLRYSAPDIVGTGGRLRTQAGQRTELITLPERYDNRSGD